MRLKKGILALGKSKEADLNVVVIDNSSKNRKDEQEMINKDTIVLLNKSDVQNKTTKFDEIGFSFSKRQ